MKTIDDYSNTSEKKLNIKNIYSKNKIIEHINEKALSRETLIEKNKKNNDIRIIKNNTLTKEKKEKKVTIFQLYYHLNRPIDYLFIILALIGSIGSGISMIAQAYISSDIFSEVGNTSERNSSDKIIDMMKIVEDSYNYQIKKLLIFGVISFYVIF